MTARSWPPEAAVWLEVNGGRRILTTCTPDHLEAQAIGFLRTEGYITDAKDVVSIHVDRTADGAAGVRVTVPVSAAVQVAKLHRHIRESGCGLMHYVTCDRSVLCAERPMDVPDADQLRELLRALFAASDAAWPEGGMHSAALTDGTRVMLSVHDVGRHNTIDKVVGRALMQGIDLAQCGIVVTSRISGAMAVKAARSGVSWIASRSVPTSLAAAIAGAAEMPVVARAGGKDMTVLHGPVKDA